MSFNPFVSPSPNAAARCVWAAVRFSAVSIGAFGIWALEGGWFKTRGGEPAMYAVIAAFFIGVSGVLLHPLLGKTEGSLIRFYKAFVPAFFVYAILWSAAWFAWGAGVGEWLGAAAGSVALAFISRRILGWRDSARKLAVTVFGVLLLHNAGYFAGGKSMAWLVGKARSYPRGSEARDAWVLRAKLSWGFFYGLGLGAGLGLVFRPPSSRASIDVPGESGAAHPNASMADS